jgi:hypothetical protein
MTRHSAGSARHLVERARPGDDDLRAAAKRCVAQRQLQELAQLRLLERARQNSTPQQQMAKWLGTSQPTISRLLNKIEADPSVLDRTPTEVINQRLVGEIDSHTMMEALTSFAYSPGDFGPHGADGFLRGDWRQIENALVEGLISENEYERIAQAAPTGPRARD